MYRTMILTPVLALLTSCVAGPGPEPQPAPPPAFPPAKSGPRCHVLEDSNWHAWIDVAPGPEAQRTLNISGAIVLPTPGFEVSLQPGPTDRMMPPGQRFELVAVSDGSRIVAQVTVRSTVTYRGPAVHPRYRQIVITCMGEHLATIPDVTTAE